MSASDKPSASKIEKAAKDDAHPPRSATASEKPQPAPELEPLDEDSLERVMRDSPL